MTSVTYLLEIPFLTRDPTEQLLIIEAGRPLPALKLASLEIVDDNQIVHSFNAEIYKMNGWICGCSSSNAFFCFPCLLFGGEDSWSSTGFNNIVHLGTAVQKHELSSAHMSNMFRYSKLKRKPRTNQTQCIEEHNRRTEKNLQVLAAIIDCVIFCAYSSISMSKQDEDDKEIFKDLLKQITSSSSSLLDYLQQVPFLDLESIKRDVLNAASEVIREEIINEIKQALCLSIIVESGDSDYPKMIILRYVNRCEPVERVWKIIHYDYGMTHFVDKLLAELHTHIKNPHMLISQSYDQLTFKRQESMIKLYVKVQNYFPLAKLVHFYRHDLLDIISGVVTFKKNYQTFCGMVWGICKFMAGESWSPIVKAVFDHVRKRFYKGAKKKEECDFKKNKIETVYQYKGALLETMITILQNYSDYPDSVISTASSFVFMLRDENNIYMLEGFSRMIPFFERCIYEYDNCLNSTDYSDPDQIRAILDGTTSEIQNQQIPMDTGTELPEIQVKVEDDLEIHDIDLTQVKSEIPETSAEEEFQRLPSTSKRRKDEEDRAPNTSKRKICEEDRAPSNKKREKAVKVVQSVMVQLQELLKYRTNMCASQLVDPRNFCQFSSNFPQRFFNVAVGDLHFFSAFESMKLRNELGVLYAQRDYQSLHSSCDVLREILDNNLDMAFPETVKLLKIVLTFPSRTDDPKRCFRTKDKVRKFLHDSQWFTNVDCLVYFRCERTLVENIDEFHRKVLHKFLEIYDEAAHFQRLHLIQ